MVKTVISFYPGAGGSRYSQKILGKNWNKPDLVYDNFIQQKYNHKYLQEINTDEDLVLTHNVNSIYIKHCFPDHKLIQIVYGLQPCLRREWKLIGIERYIDRIPPPTRLEHYNAYKDPSWPNLDSESEIEELPLDIRIELDKDYAKSYQSQDYKRDSCISTIKWHKDYYKNSPLDISCADLVVDLTHAKDAFSQFMKLEIDKYQSALFDSEWKKI